MRSYSVSLEQVLDARERRAAIQNKMLAGAGSGRCLVCLTLNIAGEVKRTPMTRMLSGRHYVETHNALQDAIDELRIMELLGLEIEVYQKARI